MNSSNNIVHVSMVEYQTMQTRVNDGLYAGSKAKATALPMCTLTQLDVVLG